jgi:hypothetical protein
MRAHLHKLPFTLSERVWSGRVTVLLWAFSAALVVALCWWSQEPRIHA